MSKSKKLKIILLTDEVKSLITKNSAYIAFNLSIVGGHTIGTSHCSSFSNRLYNFTGKDDADPSLDKFYLPKLKAKCKPNDITTLVEMDPGSFRTFDANYYRNVLKSRVLFTSDQTLLENSEAKAYLQNQVKGSPSEFFKDFGASMVKMGNIEVLTGNQGEIRKKCALVN